MNLLVVFLSVVLSGPTFISSLVHLCPAQLQFAAFTRQLRMRSWLVTHHPRLLVWTVLGGSAVTEPPYFSLSTFKGKYLHAGANICHLITKLSTGRDERPSMTFRYGLKIQTLCWPGSPGTGLVTSDL